MFWFLFPFAKLTIITTVREVGSVYSHASHPVRGFVIPLESFQTVTVEFGERIHNVCTQAGVNVFREVLPFIRSVLGPVCVIANPFVLTCRK